MMINDEKNVMEEIELIAPTLGLLNVLHNHLHNTDDTVRYITFVRDDVSRF